MLLAKVFFLRMKKIELPAEGLMQHGASAPRRRMYGRCCDQDQRRVKQQFHFSAIIRYPCEF